MEVKRLKGVAFVLCPRCGAPLIEHGKRVNGQFAICPACRWRGEIRVKEKAYDPRHRIAAEPRSASQGVDGLKPILGFCQKKTK